MRRREFLTLTALALAGCAPLDTIESSGAARLVVIGGGMGGATAAKYLRRFLPNAAITLIEAQASHVTGAASNWALAGLRSLESITQRYDKLQSRHQIQVIQASVSAIDAAKRQVQTADGQIFPYDRLIVSPGIRFAWDSIEGYSAEAAERFPHAWSGGGQLELLLNQIKAMRDGGTVLISAPDYPYRCHAAPYERASLIAHYLKQRKPKSKILIVDAKASFPKQDLFQQGWKELYGKPNGLIEWVGGEAVTALKAKEKTVQTSAGSRKADVINLIPPQQAGELAHVAGLVDSSGWCPVNPLTWESTLLPGIHVIGDAAQAGTMPKTGFAANSQAKHCAAAIAALLQEREAPAPILLETCYSLIGPQYGISQAGVYRLNAAGILAETPDAGGPSPAQANRQLEAVYADSWYVNIMQDGFG